MDVSTSYGHQLMKTIAAKVAAISTVADTELAMKQLRYALSTSSRARVSFAPTSNVMCGRNVTRDIRATHHSSNGSAITSDLTQPYLPRGRTARRCRGRGFPRTTSAIGRSVCTTSFPRCGELIVTPEEFFAPGRGDATPSSVRPRAYRPVRSPLQRLGSRHGVCCPGSRRFPCAETLDSGLLSSL